MLIDSDDYKASGVEVMFFPGGEPHAKIPVIDFTEPVVFVLRTRTWNDVGLGACVWDALRRQWEMLGSHTWTTYPKLFMPYSPAARQDKTDGAIYEGSSVDLLQPVWEDGKFLRTQTAAQIRDIVNKGL